MAIDTAEKRKSISGINYLSPGVTPNSGQDQEWRQEVGYGYSGILAASTALVNTRISAMHFQKMYHPTALGT